MAMKQKWYRWRRKVAIAEAIRHGRTLRNLEVDRANLVAFRDFDESDLLFLDSLIRRTQEKKDKHLRYLSRTPPV